MPKFRFTVDFGNGITISFQEVSGLDAETQIIEYRTSNSPIFNSVKMPGIAKTGNVTMKKGVFTNDTSFWDWCNVIKMNTIKLITVVIKLLDESGEIAMQWTLNNAWITKITGTDLKSDSKEVAVESMELAHEGMVISGG